MTVNLTDAVQGLPALELAPGAVVHPSDLQGAAFLLVADGLVVLRSSIPGSARRTITCHAGEGALVLPPEADDSLVALTPAAIVPIGATDRDRLLESPVAARLFVEALAETLRQKQAAVASLSRLHHVDRVREKLLELG